jgi:DNA primase
LSVNTWVSVSNQEGQVAETTLDLYSNKARLQEAMNLSRRLGLDRQTLEDWFLRVMNELDAQKESQKAEAGQELFAQVEVVPMTDEQREAALGLLRDPRLVELILKHMECLGYVGENEAKLLGYCVSVSRKLARPLSAIIQSGSGAGKSYLSEIIQALSPPEDVVFYSRISPQALYHMPKTYLVHKLLRLEERAGGEGCDYQIRSLQSQHKLVQIIVVKDPVTGNLLPRENEVHGPIAYLETTTNLRLNPENTSRCFEIPLDESPEQTRRVHARQKTLRGLGAAELRLEEECIKQLHHHAQRLLEPVWVVIPYVDLLTFPDRWLRTRRDHERFLCLIEVLAYLHQHQRPRKQHLGQEYIEATADDYRWAYFLANRVLQNSLDELTRWGRELLRFFEDNPGTSLTRREVREALKWPDRRTLESLSELTNMEYLEVTKGASNLFFYQLSPLKQALCDNVLGLMPPDELERLV